MSATLMHDDVWADLVWKCFVLGMANAKGEYVITLGGTRWQIANPSRITAGERVKVTRQDKDVLGIVRA